MSINTVRTCGMYHLKTSSALIRRLLQAAGRSRAAAPPRSLVTGRGPPPPSLVGPAGSLRPGLPSGCHVPVVRACFLHTEERRADRYRQKDGVSAAHRLVYVAGMDWHLRLCAIGVVVPLPLAIASAPKLLTSTAVLSSATALCLVGVVYMAVVWTLFRLVHRYVLRMYFSRRDNSYVAVLTGGLLVKVRRVRLSAGGVTEQPNVGSPLPWNKLLYSYEGGKLIMDASRFRTAKDFNRLLGYDMNGKVEDE